MLWFFLLIYIYSLNFKYLEKARSSIYWLTRIKLLTNELHGDPLHNPIKEVLPLVLDLICQLVLDLVPNVEHHPHPDRIHQQRCQPECTTINGGSGRLWREHANALVVIADRHANRLSSGGWVMAVAAI